MDKTAYVLVDFDNIDKNLRSNYSALESRLCAAIMKDTVYNRIEIRLYGGWYLEKSDSSGAQKLAPWVAGFPHVVNKTRVCAEIARSLTFENVNLYYTYRQYPKKPDTQKLVDSMICTDMIHLSGWYNSSDLFLVSSDDDFIPAIRYICFCGSNIVVIHTKNTPYSFKKEYTVSHKEKIIERNL